MYRRINGYSQKDVARILGHGSTSIISRWEKGISIPNLFSLVKLSILYKTLIDQLYFDIVRDLRLEMEFAYSVENYRIPDP